MSSVLTKPETISLGTVWHLPMSRVQSMLCWSWCVNPRVSARITNMSPSARWSRAEHRESPKQRRRAIFFLSRWAAACPIPGTFGLWGVGLDSQLFDTRMVGTDRQRAQQGAKRRSRKPSKKKLKTDLLNFDGEICCWAPAGQAQAPWHEIAALTAKDLETGDFFEKPYFFF